MSLIPYPASIPPESLGLIVDALRGKPDVPRSVHAAWHVVGYGLGQLVPDPGVALAAGRVTPLTDAQAADYLAGVAAPEGAFAAPAAAIPWSLVVPVVLRLIERWLSR